MAQVSRPFVGKSSLDLDNYVPYPATLYFVSSFSCCIQDSRRRHIIIIIIIIRHGLGLYRPVSASPNSLLFNGLPSHLRPFGLQFNTIFGIMLLLMLVTCRSQFDLYHLSFSSTGSTFNSSKISSFLL
jgi:hypothetical protein